MGEPGLLQQAAAPAVVLASVSASRRLLIGSAGICFEALPPGVDEAAEAGVVVPRREEVLGPEAEVGTLARFVGEADLRGARSSRGASHCDWRW